MALITRILISAVLFAVLPLSSHAEQGYEGYTYQEVLGTLVNPHEQITDEGYIRWAKCAICHPEVPDIEKAKSIEDVKLLFEDDLKQGCYRCHPQRIHPGGEWIGTALGREKGAPNHLIVPPPQIRENIELSMKENSVILPFEPGTGKIFCGTCHNPHERGLLIGKADTGADNEKRLRAMPGGSVCQHCHRK